MGYQETIKRCESMMQSAEDLQGSSQQIRYPLLSVFAGAEAGRGLSQRRRLCPG